MLDNANGEFGEDIICWWKLYNIELVICALSSLYLKAHAFIVMLSLWWRTKFVRVYVGYGEERNWWCLLRWWIHSVRLSLESKTWYHMHVKVSRTLHAIEICETCHTWLCDLVIMCIGEIWWMLWLCGIVDLYMLLDYASILEKYCQCDYSLWDDLI